MAEGVQDERGELAVRLGIGQAGPARDVAALDRLHRVGDHLRREADVDLPERLAGDAFLDQRTSWLRSELARNIKSYAAHLKTPGQ